MKKSIWNKRIPTLLGMLLIIIGVGLTSFLVNKGIILTGNASPSNTPQNVRITNITNNSFTASFSTDAKVIGSLNYGKDQNLGQTALDERDQQSESFINHKIHSITVQGLTPTTKYFFSITSGQDKFSNNGVPFEITTGTNIANNPSDQKPIVGKVIMPDGNIPTEGIIYLTTDNSQVISSLLKSDGTYLIPLNSIRNQTLDSYFEFSSTNIIKMLAFGDGLNSNTSLSISQINPVPTIILSKNYDFATGQETTASSSAQENPTESFPLPTTNSTPNDNPQIITPQADQSFSDQQPILKGKALPNETVNITIHSDTPIQTQVTTDASGNWTYRPTTPLAPGNHTLTIATKNSQGILQTITQSFTVYAAGTQVNPAANPPTATPTPLASPTLTPTSKPTVAPTPTTSPSPTPTATPISTAEPTATPSSSPTPTEVPTIIATPTPTPAPILAPGGNSPGPDSKMIIIGLLGGILTIIGATLLFAL